MRRLVGAMFGGSLLALAFAAPVRGAAPALTVTSSCPGLNAALVHRLLSLELAAVMNRKPHNLQVHVACQGHRATVRIVDTLTRKTVTRQFAVRHDRPDLERVVALASAQLFVVSWLELLTSTSPGRPSARAGPGTVRAARKLARRAVRKGLGWRAMLGLEVSAGARDLMAPASRPLGTYGTAVRLGLELGRRWQLTLAMAFAGGRAVRELGSVELLVTAVRLGALWRWFRLKHVELASELSVALQYWRLRGIPGQGATGGAIDGLTGEAVLGNGPRFIRGRFRVGIQLQVGVTFPAVVGRVEGEQDLRAGLLWVGGLVSLEVALW